MADLWNDALRALFAEFLASVPTAVYGDASAGDITYSENTTITENVYARRISIQAGVTVTISTATTRPIFLYAREYILNEGIVRSNGASATGAVGGGSGDYAGQDGDTVAVAATPPIYLLEPEDLSAYFTANAPGSGGTVPGTTAFSGLDWRGTGVPDWENIHTPHEYYARLDDPAQFFRLQGGSAGVQSPDTTGGAGGESGGFIGLVSPLIDTWKGTIEALGGDGSSQVGGTAIDDWVTATEYAVGDYVEPTVANGFYYEAIYAGTSGASEPTWPTASGTTTSPTFVAAGTASSADNNTVTPGLPAGLADNDLMLAAVTFRNNSGTIGTPAGWTLYGNRQNATGDIQTSVYYRLRQTGDTAPAFTVSGGAAGDGITGRIAAFRGVNTTTPIHGDGGFAEGITSADVGPITAAGTIKNGMFILLGTWGSAGGSFGGMTGDGLVWANAFTGGVSTPSGGERAVRMDYASTPTAIAMTNKTFVGTFSNPSGPTPWIGLTLELRPVLGTSSVNDNGIRWDTAGTVGAAGGGGGGWGGVVAAVYREWNGGTPDLTGGEGGDGLGTGNPGEDGGEGFFIKVVDR